MSDPETLLAAAFYYTIYAIACSNFIAAAVISYDEYVYSDTLWYFTDSAGSYTFYLVLPVWGFLVINLFLSWLLYRRTVRYLRRTPNR